MRGALCVIVRDLIVFGVLTDMMRGRPAVYATFSSYDEVAHHSGLERADTLEALRKLDQQFARIERARPYAPRPYEIVVLSDHGQTQGATFKQRNGHGLDELVERSVTSGAVAGFAGGDEQSAMVQHAVDEATGRDERKRDKNDVSDRHVVVLGSGNLGLIYLMDLDRRLTLEEIEERHPQLIPALRGHPHIGWLLVRSTEHGAVVLGPRGVNYLEEQRVEGDDPLAPFSPTAARHLLRTDGFAHVADIMVGAFYDPVLDESCAFEELISFHGGLGGPQTRAFILHPARLTLGPDPLLGAAAVHGVLSGWRQALQGDGGPGGAVCRASAGGVLRADDHDARRDRAHAASVARGGGPGGARPRVEIVFSARTVVIALGLLLGVVLVVVVQEALLSIALALVFVLGLDPPVTALERRGWGRGKAALFVFAVIGLVLFVIVVWAAKPVWDEVREFVQQLPSYVDEAQHNAPLSDIDKSTDAFKKLESVAADAAKQHPVCGDATCSARRPERSARCSRS